MVGFALAAICVAFAPRLGARPAAALLGAAMPMSATAAAVVGFAGGASVLIATIAAGAFTAATLLSPSRAATAGAAPSPAPVILLAAFTLVAITGAWAFPRIFEGATLVYSMDRTVVGVAGAASGLPLTPLRPGPGGITQSAYLISSAVLFTAVVIAARRDSGVAPTVFIAATISLIAAGALDFAARPELEYFRTATYRIGVDQALAGYVRLSGAASEPSQFGIAAAVVAAWHLWRWRETRRAGHAAAVGALALLIAGSLSTTAVFALAFSASLFIASAALRPRGPGEAAGLFIAAAAALAFAGWLVAAGDHLIAERLFNALFAEKLASESGFERAEWARRSFVNFTETFGLGVGLGAAKSSGWIAAVLGQTGVPGALLIGAFLVSVFAPRTGAPAARIAAATALAGALLSEGRVDAGYLFFFSAGAAVAAARADNRREAPGHARYILQR